MEDKKDVLLMYSGGRDSMLSASYLIERGYHVYLVHFRQVFSITSYNILENVKMLIRTYGKESITFINYMPIITSDYVNILKNYMSIDSSIIREKYGEIDSNQVKFLSCKSTMYLYAIMVAKLLGLSCIADGVRPSQFFVSNQSCIIDKYKELVMKYKMKDLLLPVYNLTDIECQNLEKNKMYLYSYIDCRCPTGFSINGELVVKNLNCYCSFYDKEILPYLVDTLDKKCLESVIERNLKLYKK